MCGKVKIISFLALLPMQLLLSRLCRCGVIATKAASDSAAAAAAAAATAAAAAAAFSFVKLRTSN